MSRFRISTIEVSGETLVNPADVVSDSQSFLAGYYLGIFPRDNAFIYPEAGLKNFLKSQFERIDTIQTKLVGWNKLEIIIAERQQQALWCLGSPVAEINNTNSSGTSPAGSLSASSSPSDAQDAIDSAKCYFLDSNGLIFSVAPNFSGDAYFKYYGNIATNDPVGQTYLSTTTVFQQVSDFVVSVGETSVTPVSILAGDGGDFTMFLSSGGKIYFNQSEPFSQTIDNLKALLQTLSESSSTSVSNIDYIDLRFGDKLYYKMK
jgi:cell division septal protein FtsQ